MHTDGIVATKSKRKRNKNRSSSLSAIDLARRYSERGDFKEALKQAKLAYRQDPSVERRGLLECVFMGRIQQLAERGARADARRVLDELLTLGVTEPMVETMLPDMMVRVGRVDKALERVVSDDPEGDGEFQTKVADQAVLHTEDIPDSAHSFREHGQAIRDALDLLCAQKTEEAIRRLAGIGRQSPFADWVLFVRGLAAYYAADYEKMEATWRRLDPQRPAARIAAPLIWLAGNKGWHETDEALQRQVKQLERHLTGCTVLPHLAEFGRQLVGEPDARKVIAPLRSLAGELRKTDRETLRYLSRVVAVRFMRSGDDEGLKSIARILEPPRHDPHWHAAIALTRDLNSDGYELLDSYEVWMRYLQELASYKNLSANERRIITALVRHHVGQNLSRYLQGFQVFKQRRNELDEELFERYRDAADEMFERAVDGLPEYAPIYADWAHFLVVTGRPTRAMEVYERALQRSPDSVETLLAMVSLARKTKEPERMVEAAKRLHELQPLDRTYRRLLWEAYLELVRKSAITGEFDAGEEALAAAEQLAPEWVERGEMQACKVALARAAGDVDRANQLIDEALKRLPEPTAFWLFLTIEFYRCQLPHVEQKLYQYRWLGALKGRRRAQTMALMCEAVHRELRQVDDLENRFGQLIQWCQEQLVPYVRRGGNLKWNRDELCSICWFMSMTDEFKVLRRLAKNGLKRFPDEPLFHACVAYAELQKPLYQVPVGFIERELGIARELVRQQRDATDPKLIEFLDMTSSFLERCRMMRSQPLRLILDGFLDEFDDEFDDDDDF